jgi:hypothetical protein
MAITHFENDTVKNNLRPRSAFSCVLKALRMILVPGPLGQTVADVDNPHAVKNVAGRFECRRDLGGRPEVKKRWKGEPHSASFIGDGGPAPCAADLAGWNALVYLAFAVEKAQVPQACGDSDVALVKDRRPLHRRTVQFLTGPTVADFGVHGIRFDFVPYAAAEAACPVSGFEILIIDSRVFRSEVFWHGGQVLLPLKRAHAFMGLYTMNGNHVWIQVRTGTGVGVNESRNG